MRTEVKMFGLSFFVLACFAGCKAPEKTEEPVQKIEELPLSVVDDQRTDLMFRYMDGDQGLKSVQKISDIPEAARKNVIVLDLSLSPEARGANDHVQIFDLSQKTEDGRYKGEWVPRSMLEEALIQKERAAAPGPQLPVTLYSASWCGVCRKARSFLKAQGILFTEKDIEKDPAAAREIAQKAAKAGIDASGVPMFDIGGRIMNGFDEKALLNAIRPSKKAAN